MWALPGTFLLIPFNSQGQTTSDEVTSGQSLGLFGWDKEWTKKPKYPEAAMGWGGVRWGRQIGHERRVGCCERCPNCCFPLDSHLSLLIRGRWVREPGSQALIELSRGGGWEGDKFRAQGSPRRAGSQPLRTPIWPGVILHIANCILWFFIGGKQEIMILLIKGDKRDWWGWGGLTDVKETLKKRVQNHRSQGPVFLPLLPGEIYFASKCAIFSSKKNCGLN